MSLKAYVCLLMIAIPVTAWASPVGEVAAETCQEDDPWFGGTSIDACAFVCEGPGTIHLTVSSSDPDAMVEGTGACGDGTLVCGYERRTCSDDDVNVAPGENDGSCSASSDEVISSALTVTCTSKKDDTPTNPPCLPIVCGDAPTMRVECLRQFERPSMVAPEPMLPRPECATSPQGRATTIWIRDGAATGQACRGEVCVAFIPVCLHDGPRLRCSTP